MTEVKLFRIMALLLKYWYITKSRLDRWFDLFYWPVIGLFVWGFTTIYLRDLTQSNFIFQFIIGGAILWNFFIRSQQDIAVFILEDFWSSNLFNMFTTPMTTPELAISTLLLGMIRSVISFFFLIIIAFLMYSFNIFNAGIFFIAFASFALMMFGWVIGMFVSGMIFRYGLRIQIFAWSLSWLIQPFSAVFYPLSSQPYWVQTLSLMFPTTYIFEGMRAVLSGSGAMGYISKALLLDIVMLTLSYIFFHKSVENARKKGLLIKEE